MTSNRIVVLMIVALAGAASAQTGWTGTISADWDDPGNWTAGVPAAGTVTTIFGGTPFSPSTAGVAGASCGSLQLLSNATLEIDAGSPLDVDLGGALNGTITGAGTLRLVGSGTMLVSGSGTLANVEVDHAGTVTFAASFTITGDLTLTGGTLVSGTTSTHLMTVLGTATFSGGSLQGYPGPFGAAFHCEGPVVFDGTDVSGMSRLRVRSSWTSDATFQAGPDSELYFDGTAPQTATLTGSSFDNVYVTSSASLTVSGVLDVDGDLEVDGALTGGTLQVAGTIEIDGTVATSPLVLDGVSPDLDGAGTLDELTIQVTGQATLIGSLTVTGDFTLVSGDFRTGTSSGHSLRVDGTTLLLGGQLVASNGSWDLNGDLLLLGTDASVMPSSATCSGDIEMLAGTPPASGTVTLDGVDQSIGGPIASFHGLDVSADTSLTLTGDLDVAGDLDVSGELIVTGVLDVDGETFFGSTSTVSLGFADHRFADDFSSNGKLHAFGTLVFDGDGIVSAGPDSPLPDVEIDTAGTVRLNTVLITGDLTLTAGTLLGGGLANTQVLGNASFEGGVVARLNNFPSTLLVEGDVTFSGTSATQPPRIHCRGDFTADASFAPVDERVVLDGPEPTSIFSSEADGSIRFERLDCIGLRLAGGDLVMTVDTLDITSGGELAVGGHTVALPAASFTLVGTLSVGPGGTLELGPATSITVNGTLSVQGAAGNPATVAGHVTGGYSLTISFGTLAASQFLFRDMGPSGLVINQFATLAAPPHDLRGGTFDFGDAAAGSTLLDVTRSQPTEFRYVTFENTGGTATHNVRATSGSTVTFVNHGGAFAGPAFEDDPGNRIDWGAPEVTQLSGFMATGGAEMATLDWTTTDEVDIGTFLLERSLSPTGPWTTIAQVAPLGPSSYQFVDLPLAGLTTFHYRLSQQLTHGTVEVLGMASATTTSAELPDSVITVGPGGAHADIQSALTATAGTPHRMIVVGSGTYPPFDLESVEAGSVRIVGQSGAPVAIDATEGGIAVRDVAPGAVVEIADMIVLGAPADAILLENVDGVVILDRVVASGGNGAAVRASGGGTLSVQGCTLGGAPGLEITGPLAAVAGGGSLDSLDVTGGAIVHVVGLVPVVTTDPASAAVPVPGVYPTTAVPRLLGAGTSSPLVVEAAPAAPSLAVAGLDVHAWTWPGLELLGLIAPNGAVLVGTSTTDATGRAVIPLPVPAAPSLVGTTVAVQAIAWSGTTSSHRWSGVTSFVVVP